MKTATPIVLTIFGGERCVTTLEDVEAVANAIHQKAVRERMARKCSSTGRGADSAQPPERRAETLAHPSTLSSELEGQIRVLNAESDTSPQTITRHHLIGRSHATTSPQSCPRRRPILLAQLAPLIVFCLTEGYATAGLEAG